ncbi:MAG: hypothetical protein ACFFHV_15530 [Promethearchaeota archaeon]
MYSKIENNSNFSLFNTKENLDKFLRILISGINLKTNKILIIGGILGKELERLFNLFPESQFLITDKSKKTLDLIKERNKAFENFKTYYVNAFDGSSLLDFLLRHGKFDLVIVSRLKEYSPKEIQLLHFYRFLYNHFLRKKGVFCIIIKESKIWEINHNILKKKKPILNEVININNNENPVHVIFYDKKRSWIH